MPNTEGSHGETLNPGFGEFIAWSDYDFQREYLWQIGFQGRPTEL